MFAAAVRRDQTALDSRGRNRRTWATVASMRSCWPWLLIAAVLLVLTWFWRAPASAPDVGTATPAAPAPGPSEGLLPASAPPGGPEATPAPAPAETVHRESRTAFVASAAATALLARAGADDELCRAIAEVLDLGPVQRSPFADDASGDSRPVTLRLLSAGDRMLRQRATVTLPLFPAVSARRYGCSTGLDELEIGQVREFVFGCGRPDVGEVAALFVANSRWVVFAGPEVERPADPVLARVPPELHAWLGRASCNVFRARVRQLVVAAPSAHRPALAQQFDTLVVDVLEVAQASERMPLPSRVTFAPQPFVAKAELGTLAVGHEAWFVSDDAQLFQVLSAFAPVR